MTIYLGNKCATAGQVKVLMFHATSSGCLHLQTNAADTGFLSTSTDGQKPVVKEIVSC